jgi:hypothetical protein
MSAKNKNSFSKIISFYFEGFKNMDKWGRQVWIIILIKLFIMFLVLKIFFFPNFLKNNFDSDKDRGDYVLEQLTKQK